MKLNWGTKIAVLYIGFVVMIVTLVAATFRRKPLLVADDYYQRETRFQERLEARKAAAALGSPPRMQLAGDSLTIELPGRFAEAAAVGEMTYYAPADPGADRTVAFNAPDGRIHAALPRKETRFLIQLDWRVNGRHYYTEIPGPWIR